MQRFGRVTLASVLLVACARPAASSGASILHENEPSAHATAGTGGGVARKKETLRVQERRGAPIATGCSFTGKNRDEIQLSLDGTPEGIFARLFRGVDVMLDLGAPNSAARLRADIDHLRFDVTVAPNDIALYANRPLVHQGVFRTLDWKPVRVTAMAGDREHVRIVPLSWERPLLVEFRKPAPFLARCTDFGFEPGHYAAPPFHDFPLAWLESKVEGRRITVATSPHGPPVLDVAHSAAVHASKAGGQAKVFLETEDGLFFGFTDPRALYEPPAGLGHGSSIGTAPQAAAETRCTAESALYALRVATREATFVATIPKEARFEPKDDVPLQAENGLEFVYVDLWERLKIAPGFRFITPKGPAVECRRQLTP